MAPTRHAASAYATYLAAMRARPYPSALYRPMSPRSSSTMRVMVVRLTSTATTKNTSGNTVPMTSMDEVSDFTEA